MHHARCASFAIGFSRRKLSRLCTGAVAALLLVSCKDDPATLIDTDGEKERRRLAARQKLTSSCLRDKDPTEHLRACLTINKQQLDSLGKDHGDNPTALKVLRSMRFEDENMVALPDFLFDASHIHELHLRLQRVQSVPAGIGRMKNLKTLVLHLPSLESLPAEIGTLPNLEHLEIHAQRLAALPNEVGRLKSLKRLHIESQQLTALPAGLGDAAALENLWLSTPQLSTFPSELGDLASLDTLTIMSAAPAQVPEFISKLPALEHLVLRSCGLKSLPNWLATLPALKYVGAPGNEVNRLPKKLCSSVSVSLQDNPLPKGSATECGP